MTRCRPLLIVGPLRVMAAARPLTKGRPKKLREWGEEPKEGEKKKPHPASKACEEKQRAIEIALARRSTDGPRGWTKADEEEEEAKQNSLLEKELLPSKAKPPDALLRPNETFVGPYNPFGMGWPTKGSQRRPETREKVDKTWREEAEKRNSLFTKALRIRKRKQLEAQALAGSCNLRGSWNCCKQQPASTRAVPGSEIWLALSNS